MQDEMNTAELEAILNENPVLKAEFTDEMMSVFCGYLEIHQFKRGGRIIEVGYPAVELKFLLSGEADVSINEESFGQLKKNDIFGEAMFSDEGIRTADVIAKTDCTVASLNLWAYESMLFNHPDVALVTKAMFERIYEERQSINQQRSQTEKVRYLSLIAHDDMKEGLINFVKCHRELIQEFPLIATGTTGVQLYQSTGVVLERKVKSGSLGGYQAIGAMISEGDIRALIFLCDPFSTHPHHPDAQMLGRLCDIYQIPFATNPATASAVLKQLISE